MQQQTEESALWQEYSETRSVEVRNRLIELHLPLVTLLASYMDAKMANNSVVDRNDLESYGSLGLMRAVELFEPARGLKFVTYASQRIRGAMLDGLRATDWVPRSAREAHKRGETVAPAEMRDCGDVDPDVNASDILPPDKAMIRDETKGEVWREVIEHLPGTIAPYIIKRHFADGADFRTIARELPGRVTAAEVEERCSMALESLKHSRLLEIMLG